MKLQVLLAAQRGLTFHNLMVLSFVDRTKREWPPWFTQRNRMIFSSISNDFK